jgi:starch-binding outer membrane protein SusE/F
MKKITIFFLVIGLIGLYSCKKDDKITLEYFNPAQINAPASGSQYVLLEAHKTSTLVTFIWSAATYNLTDLVKPTYTLQMDTAGNNFKDPLILSTTQDYTFAITVGTMNDFIIGSKYKGKGGVPAKFEYRVLASLSANNTATNNISDVITLDITPYEAVVILPPIYLLGDATTPGWDNTKALEMTHIGDAGQFAIVATLGGTGKYLKFIANLGAWAPQWGTDAAGTGAGGNLVYRPNETVTDPPSIPAPDAIGDYRITADTANLLYTITKTSEQLYLVGDGSAAGWDPSKGIAFTKVSPGIFTLQTDLVAGNLKFLETTTGWAPQWGTDANGTANAGNLVYRPDESVADPPSIPSPGTGTYVISINLATMTYEISAPK